MFANVRTSATCGSTVRRNGGAARLPTVGSRCPPVPPLQAGAKGCPNRFEMASQKAAGHGNLQSAKSSRSRRTAVRHAGSPDSGLSAQLPSCVPRRAEGCGGSGRAEAKDWTPSARRAAHTPSENLKGSRAKDIRLPQARLRELDQPVGWHVRSFQRDEVAGVRHMSELGGGQQLLVGLSVRRSRPILLSIDEVDRCADLAIARTGCDEAGKGRWGLSWQITPRALTAAMADPDRAAAKRAFEAMMEMAKIDVAAIEAARRG